MIQDSADTAQRLLDYLKGSPCHAELLLELANQPLADLLAAYQAAHRAETADPGNPALGIARIKASQALGAAEEADARAY